MTPLTPYIFIGPTLPVAEARQVLDAVYLPPVQQGDVYRLVTLRRPPVIGIIDGYFHQVPAVWHKEILWAMATGIHVFGAASMGALRAAELAPFGMQGVGAIFEAYRDGVLAADGSAPFEDDDEVAVLHAPAQLGYQALSEAMVNIRCTLASAVSAGIITRPTRDALIQRAKALFYAERGFDHLLEQASASGLPVGEIDALAQWLPRGRCDQKRDDALALLQTIKDHLREGNGEKTVDYTFQHSAQWDLAMGTMVATDPQSSPVLEELRLEGSPYFALRQEVLRRLLAPVQDRHGQPPTDPLGEHLQTAGAHELDAALLELHAKPEAIEDLWQRELSRRELQAAVAGLPLPLLERHLLACLRENGDYQRLEARANHKREVLAASGSPSSRTELSGLQALQLHDWYFEQCLRRSMPRDRDAYAESLGFSDMDTFNRALLDEYIYRHRQQQAPTQGQLR